MEEDSYIVSNFHSICRLCLRKNGAMSSLFEYVSEDSDIPLFERISELIELQIHPNDGLPSRICHRCLYKTEKCVKFRARCQDSAAKLSRITRHSSVVMVVDPGRESPASEPELEPEPEPEPREIDPEGSAAAGIVSPPSAVFMCQYCDRAFTELALCRRHETGEHDASAPYGCGACGLVFAERTEQAAHARAVHACTRPYPCGQCARAFSRRSDLRKHAVVHTGARPFRCHHCGKAFSRNTNLSKHLRIHAGHRPHVCPQCPRSFVSKGDLARHTLVHSGARPFPCAHCPLAFGRRDKLAKHEARHARILAGDRKEESIIVHVDPYKSLEEDSPDNVDFPGLPDHITGEGSFFDASRLLKEEPDSAEEEEDEGEEDDEPLVRNGEVQGLVSPIKMTQPLIQCRNCPLKFSSMVAFNKHSVIHDGMTKDFECEVCHKSFARKRELDRHAIVHTGFKPFACARCDKKFGRKDKLVRHERIHDERKEFSCFECAASFTRKDSLMSHLKTHFPDLVRDNMDNGPDSEDDDDEMLAKDE